VVPRSLQDAFHRAVYAMLFAGCFCELDVDLHTKIFYFFIWRLAFDPRQASFSSPLP
jgi:hypothetical protein